MADLAPDDVGAFTTLRPVREQDFPLLEAWHQDPEISHLMGREALTEGVADWFQRAQRGRQSRALIIEDHTGRAIGEVELEQINWRLGTAEVQIMIGEKGLWGQGLGTAALQNLLRLAFEAWGLQEIYLRVYRSNDRAVRCYEKTGFARKGRLAPSSRRGDWDEVLLMAVHRNRWLRLNGRRLIKNA